MFKKKVKCRNCGFLAVKGFEHFIRLGEPGQLEKLQILKEYGAIGFLECLPEGRDNIAKGTHKAPSSLICSRGLWNSDFMPEKDPDSLLGILNSERHCLYFFPYNPGYSPTEHKELKRAREHRRFLIIVSAVSAAVGAGIATLINYIWSLR